MMTIKLKVNKNVLLVISLAIATLVGIFSLSSCSNKSAKQNEVNEKPGETPIPLQATEQNKGQRCAARNYPYPEPTEEEQGILNYRECYRLQERLSKAALNGNLNEIREALKYGAHPQGTYYQSYPALQSAAAKGYKDAFLLLLDNGADLNFIADFQNTALNAAAYEGHIDVIKILIERGADVCYKGSGGTAEDIAHARGYKEVAELLKAARPNGCK